MPGNSQPQMRMEHTISLRVECTQKHQYIPYITRVDKGACALLGLAPPSSDMPLMQWLQEDADLADGWMGAYLAGGEPAPVVEYCKATRTWLYTRILLSPGEMSIRLSCANREMLRDIRALTKAKILEAAAGERIFPWELDLSRGTAYFPYSSNARFFNDSSWRIMPIGECMQAIHPKDVDVVQKALRHIGEEGGVFEHRVDAPAGTVWLSSRAYPFRDESGKLTLVLGQSTDISEKIAAWEESRLYEQRFRALEKHSGDLYFLLDGDLQCLYASPAAEEKLLKENRISGGRADITRAALSVLDRKHRRTLCAALQRCLKDNTNTKLSIPLPVREETRWYSCSVIPFSAQPNARRQLICVARDITPEHRQADEIEYAYTHDTLTGLPNRILYKNELRRIEEEGITGVCLILGDVNGLKLTNDDAGYAAGDQLLCEMRDIMLSVCRPGDRLMRVGNDEFVLLLYKSTLERGEAVCAAIRDACNSRKRKQLPLTISLGLSLRESADTPMREVFRRAESRMHANKLLSERSIHSQLPASLKEALRYRNMETAEHMLRMESMAVRIGQRLRLPTGDIDELILLAALHDIGKISIPDHIICKPGPLTADEWEIMRQHSEIGYRIAMSANELACIAQSILSHHERWDGQGYPQRLSGQNIPLPARIISLADAYDCMTNARVYKGPISHQDAIAELIRCSGTHFDPELVDIFVELFGGGATGRNEGTVLDSVRKC